MEKLYNEIKNEVIIKMIKGYHNYLDKIKVFPGNTDKIIDMFEPYLTFVFKCVVDTEGEDSPLSYMLLYRKITNLFETSEKYKKYSYQNMVIMCALNQYDDPINELINRGIDNYCRSTIEYINNLDLNSSFWTRFPYKEILSKIEDDFMYELDDVFKEFCFNEMDLSKLVDRAHKDYINYTNQFKKSSPEEILKASRVTSFYESAAQYFSNQYNDNGDELGLKMMRFENPITVLINHFFDNCQRFSEITSFMDDDGIELLINEVCDMFEMEQDLDPSDSHSFEEVLHEAFPDCFKEEAVEDDTTD